jgi:hypothetical protein
MIKKILIGLGVLFVVIIIIAMASGGSNSEPTKVSESNSNNAQAEQPKEYKTGDVVKLGDREFVVNSVRRQKNISYSTAKTGKEYAIVNVTIQNRGSDEVSFNTFDFKIQDVNGAQTNADAASYSLEDSLNSGSLAPNGKITGSLAFEIPEGTDAKLIFQPSFWSNDRIVVAL